MALADAELRAAGAIDRVITSVRELNSSAGHVSNAALAGALISSQQKFGWLSVLDLPTREELGLEFGEPASGVMRIESISAALNRTRGLRRSIAEDLGGANAVKINALVQTRMNLKALSGNRRQSDAEVLAEAQVLTVLRSSDRRMSDAEALVLNRLTHRGI